MKVIAQGDPVEYECSGPSDACQLYRHDMTHALIGVVTHQTDHERAKDAYRELTAIRLQLASALEQNTRLRAALAGLVGADSDEELRALEAILRITPAPDADKAAMINAIHALLQKEGTQ